MKVNLVAYLALFVALGGTSAWAIDRVTSKEIAKSAVRSKHVKDNSLVGADVKDDSLTGADVNEASLSGSQLPAGPQGPPGPQGNTGPAGADGSPDTPAQVLSKLATVDTDTSGLNADTIDGIQGAAVMQGGGLFVSVSKNTHGSSGTLLTLPGFGELQFNCNPGGTSNTVVYHNTSGSNNIWVDNGAADPTYAEAPITDTPLISLTSFPVGGIGDHVSLGIGNLPNLESTVNKGTSVEIWAASFQDGGPACGYNVQGVVQPQQ